MELLCPAGNFASAQAAISAGADAIYMGFNNETNARNFAGLNCQQQTLAQVFRLARAHQVKVYLVLNTFAQAGRTQHWFEAVDQAVALQPDALIIADLALLAYAAKHHPQQELHLSVQASAANAHALNFYADHFGITRAVLPRVLTVEQIARIRKHCSLELEVFAYGGLCIMAEGRCMLSSYLTGKGPNCHGACSPAEFVRWQPRGEQLSARLNGHLIDVFEPQQAAGYPTLCKARFADVDYALEQPTSLNTLSLIAQFAEAGVSALKIEGRQRSPCYVKQISQLWRQAIDAHQAQQPCPADIAERLATLSEGGRCTEGAYRREWH